MANEKRTLIQRLKGWFGGRSEGQPITAWGQGERGGWYPLDPLNNSYQANLSLPESERVASVYAAVMLNARAVSQCHPAHIVTGPNNATRTSTTSNAAQVLRRPNQYESFSHLILNTVAQMLFDGESLWLCPRDNQGRITSAHRIPGHAWQIKVDPETKAIYYGISKGNNPLADIPDMLVPARECCHFRMHTPRHSLIGESPVKAAMLAVGINVALSRSQMAFFSQMNRPSGILTTDKNLSGDQIKQLREIFNEQSKEINQGGVPILGMGLNFTPLGVAQSDAQLIEQQRLSVAEIARVYGVPMALLSESAGPQGGTEALIQHWLSIGLGSVIESLERSLDMLFDLPVGESIQLDTGPLLRANTEARINSLVTAVQGGVMTLNEARGKESLGPVEGGDRAFLQRQMTPVDLLLDIAENEARPPAPAPAPAPDPQQLIEAQFNPEQFKAALINLRHEKRRAAL